VIRLLFSDMDRTLLTHGYELLPAVSRAVADAKLAGMQVVLATARPPMAVRPYAAALGISNPCICLNGAWVGDVDSGVGQVLGEFAPQVARRLIDRASSEGLDTLIYTADAIYTLGLTPAIELHCKRTGERVTEIDGLHEVWLPVLKLLCISPLSRAAAAFSRLRAVLGPTADAAQSRVDLLEITSAAVSKGNAAEHVGRELGVHPSEWAAIGDSENDVSLLTRASLRLTVDNAIPAIKRIACRHFSSCDAAGFAEAVEYLITRNAEEPSAFAAVTELK
jgi:Cof subfamily protein (haloacid dehalogenase superfamily)